MPLETCKVTLDVASTQLINGIIVNWESGTSHFVLRIRSSQCGTRKHRLLVQIGQTAANNDEPVK